MRRWAILALFAATVGLYLVMLLWSLPRISAEAGGLAPFDMRPGGYSFDEARTFLTALSEEGRRFYLDVQHRLDLFYPALLALSLSVGLAWAWRGLPRAALAAMVLLAFTGAGFDYLENLWVGTMLTAGPEQVSPEIVAAASRRSVAKAALTTVVMLLLLAGLARRGWRRWRARG